MKFKRIQDDFGEWIDDAGNRFSLIVVRRIRNSHGANVGYEAFPSFEAALAAWGLRPVSHASVEDEQALSG